MILLHAITREPVEIEDLPSGDGARLREVACGPLRALVSERDHPSEPTARDVVHHAELVDVVSRETDALPVRFGVLHRDEERLREAVRNREDGLLSLLDRLAGRVEFVIRAQHPLGRDKGSSTQGGGDPDAGSDTSGRAYLEERLAEHRANEAEQEAIGQRIDGVVARCSDLVVETLEREGRSGPERCILVERDDAERFVAVVSAAVAEDDGLVLGGPWPPYTFAELTP